MEIIKNIIDFIKKIFNKNSIKMLEKPSVNFVENDDTEFLKYIRVDVKNFKKEKIVETMICHGDGLGIQNKITA